ncbi:MAG: FAD-binding protein [Paracoccus sp. (in: a-proteobacteria)]|uniref:FAD-binding protein n=1 Tax=Paracoccus sp. TaxID=267 RepID=UPI0026E0C7C4|nr:FAD-binding protein [Paracoccus sp. (in: a-proteobacteria)]MDO5612093.1 FAD-binding protein [Paracoccus sp. (in: a-proteobacteria)]
MRPATEDELAEMIRTARAPLAVHGGGTRLWPGKGQGTPLTTAAMTGITLYEPAALTLVVRAGTPLAEVHATLAAQGQMLGFEPDTRPGSTIGGVAAANASGPRRVLAGACRDAMIGLRMVDGTGTLIRSGGRVMKNVTGYDLVKLTAGSRGQLGVLTEIAFKTTPIPPARAILHLPGLTAPAAIPALTAALTAPFDVSAAQWQPGQGALLRIEGLPESVAIRRDALATHLSRFATVQIAPDSQPLPVCPNTQSGGDLWRIVTTPGAAPALLAALPEPALIDWGGALIWVELPRGQPPHLPPFPGHARKVNGIHPGLIPPENPAIVALGAAIRSRFDPRGLFGGGA